MDITEQNLKADDILKQIFGYSSFRNGQEEIVKNILSGKQTLAIMPTGAGKSLCYQIPAIASEQKTVVISPLISLIENQVADLRENGIKVEKLHSNQSSQNRAISWNNFKAILKIVVLQNILNVSLFLGCSPASIFFTSRIYISISYTYG